MKINKFLDEIYNSVSENNTMTPLWSYSTLLTQIGALNFKEVNHISTYSPKDSKAGLGRTASGLPIKHYALGTGRKHVLVIGGEHGNDIINSQAIYFLMSYLSKKVTSEKLTDLLKEYSFDFVPVLNPEGYIITTSAVDYYIKKSTKNQFDIDSVDSDKAITLFKEYFQQYSKVKEEAWTPINNAVYSYQELFSGFDETAISKKYQGVRHQLSILHRVYNIPYEIMANFSSNGNGVDILANTNNSKIYTDINKAFASNQCLYNSSEAYRNIPISYPSSRGCPSKAKDSSGKIIFELENENLALLNYSKDLEKKKHSLDLIMSVHSDNKIIKAKKYLEYNEADGNPCGPFADPEIILETYLKFVEKFTTTFENLVQKDISITTKKGH